MLFAVGLAAFLGLVGLSVDVGRVMWAKTDLQRTVDAAALAGSQLLPNSPEQALLVADQYVTKNGGAACQPNCATLIDGNKRIAVQATRTIDHWFLPFFGVSESKVATRSAVKVTVVTGAAFNNPAVFPYTIWGGNDSYPNCNAPYGLCAGATKTYRSNNWDKQVDQAQKNNGKWSVNGNNFKGYFNVSQGSKVHQASLTDYYSFGGNATGQQPLDQLRDHYLKGRPIVIPVIIAGNCTNNCGELHFKIVAWVALKLDNDPTTTMGDWTGKIVAGYQIPDGYGGGYEAPPPAALVSTPVMVY